MQSVLDCWHIPQAEMFDVPLLLLCFDFIIIIFLIILAQLGTETAFPKVSHYLCAMSHLLVNSFHTIEQHTLLQAVAEERRGVEQCWRGLLGGSCWEVARGLVRSDGHQG